MMPRQKEKRNKNLPEFCLVKRPKSGCSDPEKLDQEFTPETKKDGGRGKSYESVKRRQIPRTRMCAKNSAPSAGIIQDGGAKIAARYACIYSLPPESDFPNYSTCTRKKRSPQTVHKSSCHLSDALRVSAHTCTSTENTLLNGSNQSKERGQQCIRTPFKNEVTSQTNGYISGSPVSDITAIQNGAFKFTAAVYSSVQTNSQNGGDNYAYAHAFSDQEQDRSSLSSSLRSNSSRKSDLETDDIDMDTIYPVAVYMEEEDYEKTPHSVPLDYADLSSKRTDDSSGFLRGFRSYFKSRSKTTAVFIKHQYATDDPVLGDRFGASIETYNKQKDGYYRHVIRQADVNGVADRMKISEGDEVVLLNDTFVPELDHKAVLKLFQEVPVDSHTRFALVLRRPLPSGKWEWVCTSAILIPELPNEPRVRDLEFSTSTGPQTFSHWYQLKVPGTNLFVIIVEGQVRVEVATSENHKKYSICVMVKMSFDDKSASYIYNACVFGMHHEERNRNIYLHVEDRGDVGLNESPQWFGYELGGGLKMALKVHELNQYIGCQTSDFGQSGKLLMVANRENAWFERWPIAGSYDHPDSESDRMSEPPSLSSSRSSAYSSGNFSQPGSEPLSLELSDASSGSYESWSNSSHGDSGYHRNLRSSRSRPESFEDPVSDTGSEYLSYGSEYLSCGTITNSCGTPNTPMANMRLSFSCEGKP